MVTIIEILKHGIDSFKFEAISDAFGAKMISERGYSPQASLDLEISGLIKQRDNNLKTLGKFQIFSERLEHIQNDIPETISVNNYFDMCINCLRQIISLTNSKETKYLEYLNHQIEKIDIRRTTLNKISDLNQPLTKDDFLDFIKEGINFDDLCKMYEQKIPCRLNVIGLKKGINNIFHPVQNSESNILKTLKCNIISMEDKFTPSGHEGIHVDVSTLFGPFELQLQNLFQYTRDQIGKITAHALMSGKEIPLIKPPKPYKSDKDVPSDYHIAGTDLYLNKSAVDYFYYYNDVVTPKTGIITYNQITGELIWTFSSTIDNLKAVTSEIPDGPLKNDIQRYFAHFSSLSYAVKSKLVHHLDAYIIYHLPKDIITFSSQVHELEKKSNYVEMDQI